MTHKHIAIKFLNAAASGNVDDAYDKYVSADFIHHNQYFAGDRASLLAAMKEASISHPNKSLTVKRIIEEENIVITHSHVISKSDDPDVAVLHIFRFVNDKIVELWDLGQLIDRKSPNKNGMF